jgi:large subunit ribosomal protein L31e
MAITRTYIIPLRKGTQRAPNYKRTPKAIKTLREFLVKHMKSEKVILGQKLNEKIWERGIKNPIHKVSVDVIKEDDGTVKAELTGFKWVEPIKPKVKEEKKKGLAGKIQDLKKSTETEEEPKEEEEKKEKPKPKAEAPKAPASNTNKANPKNVRVM